MHQRRDAFPEHQLVRDFTRCCRLLSALVIIRRRLATARSAAVARFSWPIAARIASAGLADASM